MMFSMLRSSEFRLLKILCWPHSKSIQYKLQFKPLKETKYGEMLRHPNININAKLNICDPDH